MVLILLLELQTRRQPTLATKNKFGMFSEISNRQQNAHLIG